MAHCPPFHNGCLQYLHSFSLRFPSVSQSSCGQHVLACYRVPANLFQACCATYALATASKGEVYRHLRRH